MPVNDPVGDMLTRIRNASRARHDKVVIPTSKHEGRRSPGCSRRQGYIADFVEHDVQPQGEITLQLKYGPDKSPVITGIRRISKPGLRRYVPVRDIRPVLGRPGHQHPLHQPGHPQRRRGPQAEHRRRADLHGVLT